VIVRLMSEGQWRVDDSLLAQLNELDDRIEQAITAGDEEALHRDLRALAETVRSNGEKLPDDDLSSSDAIVPPDDLSIEEARELLAADGFIPDIPVP
jgi:chromosome condensin MukBEF complex kleisin-like MukF subunit